jgi:hypothetical protein
MTQPRVPSTDSISELAAFWSTHDLTDYEDELEAVEGPVFAKPTKGEYLVSTSIPKRRSLSEKLRGPGESTKPRSCASGFGSTPPRLPADFLAPTPHKPALRGVSSRSRYAPRCNPNRDPRRAGRRMPRRPL